MGLEQAIKHKKGKRKPYYGTKAVDPSCRNHGSCAWCKRNRAHKKKQEEERLKDMEDDL